jgi:YD repeat-containing protein
MNKISTCFLLLLLIVSAQSCKKDAAKPADPIKSVDDPKGKIYLIERIVEHPATGSDRIHEFNYDDKNRMISVKFTGAYDYDLPFGFYDHHTDGLVTGGYEYKYTYDTADRLTGTKIYDVKNALWYTFEYEYSANQIKVSRTNLKSTHTDIYTYILKNGQIVQSKYWDDDYIYVYTHDSRVNITQAKSLDNTAFVGEANYTYDDKKSPFSMVKSPSIHLLMPAVTPLYSAINNITSVDSYSQVTYKYNDEGFPASAVVQYSFYPQANINYEYKVK